jgi:hypothetical protein
VQERPVYEIFRYIFCEIYIYIRGALVFQKSSSHLKILKPEGWHKVSSILRTNKLGIILQPGDQTSCAPDTSACPEYYRKQVGMINEWNLSTRFAVTLIKKFRRNTSVLETAGTWPQYTRNVSSSPHFDLTGGRPFSVCSCYCTRRWLYLRRTWFCSPCRSVARSNPPPPQPKPSARRDVPHALGVLRLTCIVLIIY